MLMDVDVIELTDTTAEHDGLDVLSSLSVAEALAIGTSETSDDRLTELVTVVGSTIGGLDLNGQGMGDVG